jgi:2-polyprenyl-3-methyl-5-hydroxy-6-metoxy-1,4-benzoquinol methylase
MEIRKESVPEILHDRNWQIAMNEMEKFDELPRVKIARDWIITNKPRYLLDVGCGPGYLARIIKNYHLQIEIHGIDFSKTAIDHASNFLERSWRLDIDYEDIPAEDGSYDAIICMEVLEHVYNVTHIMNEIRRVLNHRGKALISVPNLAYWRYRFQLLKGVLPHPEVFSSEHIHAFVLSSLQEKLAQSGLYISEYRGYGNRIKFLAEKFPQLFSSTIFVECHS